VESQTHPLVTDTTFPDSEFDAAIHEEVNRLPEKFRAPIVLCDLQGHTHQEAARFLGWPIGTVKSRQSHARALLRERLVRRGLGFGIAATMEASIRKPAIAAIPKKLSQAAVAAAMRQSAHLITGLSVSARVIALNQGVLRAMFWAKIRSVAVATLAVALASSGVGVYVRGSQPPAAGDQPALTKRQTNPTPAQPPADLPRIRLRAQQLSTRKAKALYEIARANRELAAIALEEYEDVLYPRDLAVAEGEIKLAETDLRRSEDRVDWAGRMFDQGYVSQAQKTSEVLNLEKAKFAVELAGSKRKVLVDYTKRKSLNELLGAIEKANLDERTKNGLWNLEQAKEVELERQLGLRTK
jgi:hypothetical protein